MYSWGARGSILETEFELEKLKYTDEESAPTTYDRITG